MCLCVCGGLCRWYHFPLCAASLCRLLFDFGTLSQDCLWQCSVPQQWNKHGCRSRSFTLHTNIQRMCTVMSGVCWHAMRQMITRSLTATEHEKGWSSMCGNRAEWEQDNGDLKEGSKPFIRGDLIVKTRTREGVRGAETGIKHHLSFQPDFIFLTVSHQPEHTSDLMTPCG